MIEQIGENLVCRCFYTSGGAAKTGITVTVDVLNPAGTQIITGASASEIGSTGVYQYTLSSASVTTAGLYSFIFKTSDTTVDIKDFQLGYDVGTDWVERVDADISSRSDFDETTDSVDVGSINGTSVSGPGDLKADVSNLDATVSSRASQTSVDNLNDFDPASDTVTVGTNNDKTDYALSSAYQATLITAIWAAASRTLTSFGTLASDTATAVWAAGTRTLTGFGTLIADIWAYATRELTGVGSSGIALEATSQEILNSIDNILLVSDGVSFVADGQNITTGSVVSGSYVNTQTHNNGYFEVQESGNALDFYLTYDIGERRIPTKVVIYGRYEEGGTPPYDDTIDIDVYNWNTTSWDHISPISGDFTNSTTDEIKELNLNENHVDSSGNVHIRFYGTTLETGSIMYIDYVFVSAANNISELSTFDHTTDEVITDSASRTASQADVSALALETSVQTAITDIGTLNDFDPATETVDIGAVTGTPVTDVDDFKADVSSLATSAEIAALNNLSAQQVWEYVTRTLTSGGGTTPADVWAYATRTLTSGAAPSAADIWSYATRSLTEFPGVGSGLRAITIQIYETGTTDAIGDTLVSIVSGGTVYAYGMTGLTGQLAVNLDDGSYDIRLRRANVYFSGSETLTVSGDGTHIYYGTIPSVPTPTLPSDCYLYEDLRGINGDTIVSEDDMIAKVTIVALPYDYSGYLWTGQTIAMNYDENSGRAFIEIVRLATVKLEIPTHGVKAIKTIPDSASARWSDIS